MGNFGVDHVLSMLAILTQMHRRQLFNTYVQLWMVSSYNTKNQSNWH